MFADDISQSDPLAAKLFDGVRMVKIHPDVLMAAQDLAYEDGDKIANVSKYTCWPDFDTWIECDWGRDEEYGHRLQMGFLFHGSGKASVLEGHGLVFMSDREGRLPTIMPVRYDLQNYRLEWCDLGNHVRSKLMGVDSPWARKALSLLDDRRGTGVGIGPDGKLVQNDEFTTYDPIATAARTQPMLSDTLRPLIIALLALMNSPKLIRQIPSNLDRLNAKRIKRGKYPYHPHHEVHLNIDKHVLSIKQGRGSGPERAQHFVRAHLRFLVHPRYKNVSVVLVPPHTRGNPELGIMNTSYAVDRENSRWVE